MKVTKLGRTVEKEGWTEMEEEEVLLSSKRGLSMGLRLARRKEGMERAR